MDLELPPGFKEFLKLFSAWKIEYPLAYGLLSGMP
jgi:hypothetical protein